MATDVLFGYFAFVLCAVYSLTSVVLCYRLSGFVVSVATYMCPYTLSMFRCVGCSKHFRVMCFHIIGCKNTGLGILLLSGLRTSHRLPVRSHSMQIPLFTRMSIARSTLLFYRMYGLIMGISSPFPNLQDAV